MAIRTDLAYENGNLKAVNSNASDTAFPLPDITTSQHLESDAYGESWRSEAGDNDAVNSLAVTQSQMSETFKSLRNSRNNQHPDQTQSAHLRQVSKQVDEGLKRTGKMLDSSIQKATNEISTLDKQFRDQIGVSTSSSEEQTGLQKVLRGMSTEERTEAISNAVANGDGAVIGAALYSHPMLSGLSHDQQQAYLTSAKAAHAPKLLQTERTLEKGMDVNRKAYIDLLDRSDELKATDVRSKHEDKARRAEDAAAASQWNVFNNG